MKTAVPMRFRGTDRLQQLFTSPSRWTKKYFGKDSLGYSTNPDHRDAVRFCLLGGVRRCYPVTAQSAIRKKLTTAINKLYPKRDAWNLTMFNDDRSTRFADILRVIKKARV
jgi:hypothetical protein